MTDSVTQPGEPAYKLSPTQEAVGRAISEATRVHPVVQIQTPGDGIATGVGITSLLKHLSAEHNSILPTPSKGYVTYLGLGTTIPAVEGERDLHAVFKYAVDCWAAQLASGAPRAVLFIDDIDLLARPTRIYSNRISNESESYGFYKTAAESTLLVKMLMDHVTARPALHLVFRSTEEHFMRFVGTPFTLTLPQLTAADYRFFVDLWLPDRPEAVDTSEVHAQFPQLSIADLRVACLPPALEPALAPPPAPSHPGPLTTPQMLQNIYNRLGKAQGALPLENVEKVELSKMPGLESVVELLETHVVSPMENADLAAEMGAEPKAGVLLYGPPGTGKTSVGRWLAHRLKGKVFMMKEMFVWKEMLETFARAEANAPSVVFIDDIDVLLAKVKVAWGGQGDIFRYILGKLDGLASYRSNGKYVCVVMACNDLRLLPEALIRSGRVELWVKTERPDGKKRLSMLHELIATDGKRLEGIPADVVKEIADRTEDWNASDIRRLVKDARNLLVRQQARAAEPDSKDQKTTGQLLMKAYKDMKKMIEDVEYFQRNMYT